MILDKKQIWGILFLFKFKMDHKVAKIADNIHNTFGPETANIQWSGGSRSFSNKMRALKMRTIVTSHHNLTMTNWEQSLKLIFLQLHEKLPKKNVDHYMVIGHLKQIGKVKKLNKWMPHELTKNWKNHHFEAFSYSTQERTISQLDCNVWWKVDFIQLMMTSSVVGLRRSPKALSQSQTLTKKKERSWSLFGGLLPMWSTTAFWIPAKPLHLRSMLSELIRCPQNYNVCSQHWSTIWPQFFSTTMPNCTWHNKCFKSWMHWAVKFCLICHIHLISCQWTTTSSSILTTFCRESASTSRRRQKILSMSSWTPIAWIFMLQE